MKEYNFITGFEKKKPHMKLYESYYKPVGTLYQIMKSCYKKEFALISKKQYPKTSGIVNSYRHKYVTNTEWLRKLIDMLCIEQNIPRSMYVSVAEYSRSVYLDEKGNRITDYDDLEYHEMIRMLIKKWKFTSHEYIEHFPLFIDIDSDGIDEIEKHSETVLTIHELLKRLNVPHEVRFSGMGFHILIHDFKKELKHSYIPTDKHNLYMVHYAVAKKLKDMFSDNIDLSIFDSRRLIKVPYSLAVYPISNPLVGEMFVYFVVMPLFTTDEISNFDYKLYEIKNYNDVKNIQRIIYNRGTKVFNSEGSIIPLLKFLNVPYESNENKLTRVGRR